jgi:hypothetical protein
METHSAANVLENTQRESKLNEMGLDEDCIVQAIRDGLIQFQRANEMHPLTHAGSSAWGEIVCTVRAKLRSFSSDWGFSLQSGLSLTHNKISGITLIVTSGDKDTGLVNGEPSTKNKKGPSTRNIVDSNQIQDMFDDEHQCNSVQVRDPIDSTQTWVLLYRFDKGLNEIRFELSLPSSTAKISGKDDKLKIDSWKTRILFEPIPFDSITITNPVDTLPFSDEITFEISKKA